MNDSYQLGRIGFERGRNYYFFRDFCEKKYSYSRHVIGNAQTDAEQVDSSEPSSSVGGTVEGLGSHFAPLWETALPSVTAAGSALSLLGWRPSPQGAASLN